jgi:acyl-CoA synthetase (NDP forming)/GNAT superfamily N-acetyltransferase
MSVTTGTVRALLADGQQVQLRPATPADEPALARLSADHSLSLRFFAVDHADAQDVLPRVLPDDPLFGFALLALLGDDIVGLAAYQTMDTPHSAETALLVSDMTESLGIGALLLEHLVSHARRHGVEILHAEVLVENSQALQVFADMGLTPRTRRAGSALLMDIPLRYDERYLDALAQREIEADVASLTPLLAPTSVAVVGASRTGRGVGHALLTHLLESGFQGPVFPVHPQAETLAGLPAFPSIGALPETPELVVLAVPADRVADIAEQCGRRGVRGLLVVSAGLGTGPEGRRLLEVVRRYGMRLIGPSGAGIANTDPMVALDAHVAHGRARPGDIGVVAQAGGIGIALLEALSHIGLGISTFVSTGERFDVSSNDMLRWWGSDEGTKVACIYVESFGNPRKFARLARRLAHRIPIVAVRSVDVTAQPAVARDALFEQAGIIATDDLRETIDVLTFLDTQPLPAGPRVAIVSNAGGGAALAASAGERYDLRLATLTRQDTLTVLMPGHAHAVNPVDTTVDIEPDVFGRVVRAVADDPNVDAVLVVLAPLAWDGLDEAVEDAAGAVAVPLAVARLGQAVAVTVRPAARGRRVPVYSDPAAALRALGHAQRYARWREQIPGSVPETSDVDKETSIPAVAGSTGPRCTRWPRRTAFHCRPRRSSATNVRPGRHCPLWMLRWR